MNSNNSKKHLIIVMGSTASGKSDYAINLAKEINGEIISADSRQVYKDLDVGSGKVTVSEMQNIIHYGLDITDPEDKFTTADFMFYADRKIEEIINQNKTPILCGGTGMYIEAVLLGIEDNPGPNYSLRKDLTNKTLKELQEILYLKNPQYYNSLNNSEKNNKARLIRKIELENFEYKERAYRYDATIHLLDIDKDLLKKKIEVRLDKRFEHQGMVEEIRNLIENAGDKEKRIEWLLSLGLEYKYVTEYVLGKIDKDTMINTLKTKIYQYAKRQITWNKRYKDYQNLKIIKVLN
ncbi:MAG: tRNA dimethylallyltransferase [Patescibacteria group bacterium]|nr:tRNA dimethylallyltransferase [Patescibacteria group bacterium]